MIVSHGIDSSRVHRRQCSFMGKFAISLLGSRRSHPTARGRDPTFAPPRASDLKASEGSWMSVRPAGGWSRPIPLKNSLFETSIALGFDEGKPLV
jgi:hypothetical protein